MHDDLYVTALGDKLDIARIQAFRLWWRRSLKRLPMVCVLPSMVMRSVPPLLDTFSLVPLAIARDVSPPME